MNLKHISRANWIKSNRFYSDHGKKAKSHIHWYWFYSDHGKSYYIGIDSTVRKIILLGF